MPGAHAAAARRRSMWPALVPIAAIAAGALFSSSFRAAQDTDLRSTVTGLPDLIRQETQDNAARARQVSALGAEVEELTRTAAPTNQTVAALKEQADHLAAAAGLAAVSGPAMKVTLNDAPLDSGQLPQGASPNDVVVHQQDVQAVVNALWAGGAEAMMLQDQRVIATSAVRCVGNTLVLQGRVYSPPYVVTAIGDPARLSAALEASREVQIYREYVAAYGLEYEHSTVEKTNFPAYSGTIAPERAVVPHTEPQDL